MEVQSLPIACHGKLPSDREYVHYQIGSLPAGALDEWVRTAHARAFFGRPPGVRDAYDHAPAYRFAFSSGTPDGPLLGVLKTSHDATGRRYPFWVAWNEPSAAVADGLPGRLLRGAGRFDLGRSFVVAATEGDLSRAGVAGQLERMRTSGAVRDVRAAYDAFLHDLTPRQLVAGATGGSDELTRALLASWMDVIVRSGAVGASRIRYGLKLPLCTTSDSSVPADRLALFSVAFWTDATTRLLGRGRSLEALFWTDANTSSPNTSSAGPATGDDSVLVFQSAPPHRLYGHLLNPHASSQDVYDVAAALPDNRTTLPVHLRTLLDRPDLPLASFLNHLRR